MGSFVDVRLLQLPKWLNGPQGRAFVSALGAAYDVELTDFKFAIKQRFPSTCEASALDTVGGGFRLERYDGEPLATFRARLQIAWDTWRKAGTAGAIIDSLHAYGVPDVEVYASREIGEP